MSKLQPARGTRDIVGEEARRFDRVIGTFRQVAGLNGFEQLATPIFEFTEVFKRPLGEASDVVSKEMYSFTDRGGEDVTLRPEFTASVARAFISGGMQQNLPCRLYSHGPLFRYERPQKGRFRQFHQINAEVLGLADAETDVEVIALAAMLLDRLGLIDDVTLHLNTLGDRESRDAYRAALVDYFSGHRATLSEDSLARLGTNPLRILDSKDDGDRTLVADAPRMSDYLNDTSRDFFASVRAGLDAVGVAYVHDERLVRGLDYYTHTAFEFITDTLGAQGTVIGGGRYDGLIKTMGGPETPGVGWAGGIDRLAMMLTAAPAAPRPVVIMPMGEAAVTSALKIAHDLRAAGIRVIADRRGNMGKRMKRADKVNARIALVIGDEELAAGMVTVKDLDSGGQTLVSLGDLATTIADKH